MKCALCRAEATCDRLCGSCDLDRLRAASVARIAAGTGLTYENVEAFSQENYIKMVRGEG